MDGPSTNSIILLKQFQAGDVSALNRLFERYGQRILIATRARLGPGLRQKLHSMDIVQEVLIDSLKGLETFEPRSEGALTHWFSTLAANRIRDKADYFFAQKRSLSREVPLEDTRDDRSSPEIELKGPDKTPSAEVIVNDEVRALEEALDALEEDVQEVIRLRNFEGMDFGEIGEKMGRSPDAARMFYHRALEKLTSRLADQWDEGNDERK